MSFSRMHSTQPFSRTFIGSIRNPGILGGIEHNRNDCFQRLNLHISRFMERPDVLTDPDTEYETQNQIIDSFLDSIRIGPFTREAKNLICSPVNRALLANIVETVFSNAKDRPELYRAEVVSDIIVRRLKAFYINIEETYIRCFKNMPRIKHAFGYAGAGIITDIQITDSDPHNRGHRVAIVTLDGTHKIVYKPRDIRIDAFFCGHRPSLFDYSNHLLRTETASIQSKVVSLSPDVTYHPDELDTGLPTNSFLALEDEGGHFGVVEYLSCEKHTLDAARSDYVFRNKAEARNYYKQIGREFAIARLYGIGDLHQENLIVHQKQPFLTDLEVSFHTPNFREASCCLEDALTKFGGEFTPTQNWVFSLEDDLDTLAGLHLKYLSEIRKGFLEMMVVFKNHSADFVHHMHTHLPEDVYGRYLILATTELKFLPILPIHMPSREALLPALNDYLHSRLDEVYDELREDLLSGDILMFQHHLRSKSVFFRGTQVSEDTMSALTPLDQAERNLRELCAPEKFAARISDIDEFVHTCRVAGRASNMYDYEPCLQELLTGLPINVGRTLAKIRRLLPEPAPSFDMTRGLRVEAAAPPRGSEGSSCC
jgi:hypothetical protein